MHPESQETPSPTRSQPSGQGATEATEPRGPATGEPATREPAFCEPAFRKPAPREPALREPAPPLMHHPQPHGAVHRRPACHTRSAESASSSAPLAFGSCPRPASSGSPLASSSPPAGSSPPARKASSVPCPRPAPSTHSIRKACATRSREPQGQQAAVDLRSASPDVLLRYSEYCPRYPSPAPRPGSGLSGPKDLVRPSSAGEVRPVLGLRCLLPCPLRSERLGCDREAPAAPPDEETVAAFEDAFERLLAALRMSSGSWETTVEMDESLGKLTTTDLWRIGCRVSRGAPRDRRVPGYTRYHCFAMCVADHLESRGVRVK